MKIIKLGISNYKKIRAVEIRPDGNVVTITGKNGSGKTSCLDSIVTALGGKNSAPKKPIRDGEEKAVIVVEMEDIVVTRKFTASGSYLEVANKDGAVFKSPQAILDKLVGQIAFDPVAFIQESDREQRQILIQLMGVDLGAHDKKITELSDHRKKLMGQKKEAELDLSRMPMHTDAPVEEVSMMDLVIKLKQAGAANKRYEETQQKSAQELSHLAELNERLRQLKAEIEQAEQRAQETQAQLATMQRIDTAEIEKQIADLEATNRKVRENQSYGKSLAAVNAMGEQITADYRAIQQAEADKANALANVKLPLEGLSVDENGVTYNGIPLSQVNHASQVEISMAIGMALNPKLRVMLIDGNGLDSDTKKAIYDLAAKHDFQVWQEVVTDGETACGVVIEDGTVKEFPKEKTLKERAIEAMLQ